MEEEKKTELRTLFEESLKKPSKFSLFSNVELEGAGPPEQQNQQPQAKPHKKAKLEGPTVSELFLQVQKEINERWPEPVGRKFMRTDEEKLKASKAQMEVAREQLKEQSKRKLKTAMKKGMTIRPKVPKKKPIS